LGQKATDYILLFVAPVLVTRPQLAHFKFEILSALWCLYSRKAIWTDVDALQGGTGSKTEIKKEKEQEQDIVEEKRTNIEDDRKKDTQKKQVRNFGKRRKQDIAKSHPEQNIATGKLRCIDDLKEFEKLGDWFALALFGRHVRLHEARTWRERCKRYLPSKLQEQTAHPPPYPLRTKTEKSQGWTILDDTE
jgi:hypothetical protein